MQVESVMTALPEDKTKESTAAINESIVADDHKAARTEPEVPKEETAASEETVTRVETKGGDTKVEAEETAAVTEGAAAEENEKEIAPPPEEESSTATAVQETASESVQKTALQAHPAEKVSVETLQAAEVEAAGATVSAHEAALKEEVAVGVKEDEKAVETAEKVAEPGVTVKTEVEADVVKAEEEKTAEVPSSKIE